MREREGERSRASERSIKRDFRTHTFVINNIHVLHMYIYKHKHTRTHTHEKKNGGNETNEEMRREKVGEKNGGKNET